jgi:cell division protein FtsB
MKPEREQMEETKQSRWGFRGMTVRNWLELLIVPLVLVGIGLLFENQQAARQQAMEAQQQALEERRAEAERELAEQRAQDEALQAYLDQMSQLMLERKLLEAEQGDPVHTLAQARTSTAILRLDAEHNHSVTRFLINSGLAVRSEGSPRLLREITLSHAKLSDAYLYKADLSGATLEGADLSGASLKGADLSGPTVLVNAEGITNEKLAQQAASLEGAYMPLPPGKFSTYKFEPAFLSEGGEDWTELAPEMPDEV